MKNEFYGSDHIMLDIETLSTTTKAVVHQICAVQFCPMTGETFKEFEVKISIQSLLDAGFNINESTLFFWLKQSEEARQIVLDPNNIKGDKVHYVTALGKFNEFIKSIGGRSKMWGNGPSFDSTKVVSMFEVAGIEPAWKHWNDRCVRTINAFDPSYKKSIPFVGVQHHGIDDCKHQIKYIHSVLKNL